ncbi:uncharacterized protein LOC144107810 isoform X3 [Amblyomma americanum]
MDEILAEVRTLLPNDTASTFVRLKRTLRELGVRSRNDMKLIAPVDLVNALGRYKADIVAAHFNMPPPMNVDSEESISSVSAMERSSQVWTLLTQVHRKQPGCPMSRPDHTRRKMSR